MRILLTFAFFLLCGVGISAQKIYRVNTTDDVDDGQCDNTHCSLREAINGANTDGIASLLWFELNGNGLKVINLESALPAITEDNLLIDGTTLASNLPTAGRLIIDGQALVDNCFDIKSTGVRIYGFQIQNFKESAILIKNASLDTLKEITIGRRKQGNIFVNNGYAVNAENVSKLVFQANLVGTNMNFEQGFGNRNGVFLKNDWDSYEGALIQIGGKIDELEQNYFVNCSETAIDMTYHGAGIIEGNVFGTGRMRNERMGNNIGINIANLHGRIDIGGSPNTKNTFAHNNSAVIVNRNNFVRVSENSFYCNDLGLSIIDNAHPIPVIGLGDVSILSGQAQPNDFVEIYVTDAETCNSQDCQGMTYLGVTRAGADGIWEFSGAFKYGQQMVALSRNNGRQSMFSECFRLCPAIIESEVTNAGPYCSDDVIQLSLEPAFTGNQWISNFTNEDITYDWIGPNEYASNEQNPETATQGGTYIGQAYLFGCPSIPDTTEVLVTNLKAEIEGDDSYCRAENITLNSNITANASQISYRWTGPNGYTSVFKNPTDVKDSGEYNLVISGNGCQSEVASITIENHFPEPYSLGEAANICEGEPVNLTLPTFNSYQWSGDFDLACDTCQSISFVPTQSGNLSVNLGPTATCYASANLAIEVVSSVSNTQERILCPGSSLNLLAQNITEPGIYSSKYIGANGCDSTQTFIVVQPEANTVYESKTICEGETFLQFGQTYTTSGTYQANFTGANGCDSTHTVALTVLSKITTEATYAICAGESMSIFGTEMMETTTQTQTYTGTNGCDSIHTIHLLVKETYDEVDKITLCAGETTNILDGIEVTESGVFEKAFVSSLGCDSVVMIEVEVLESISSVNVITMCDKDAVASFGDLNAVPEDSEVVYTAQSGCDSISYVSYNITISQETEEAVTICSSDQFLIDGKEITESGKYVNTYSAANGCDSTHIVDLKILSPSIVEESFAICAGESMSIFGMEMTETTTQTQTYTGTNGCDSIHTIHLLVKETYDEVEKIVLCAGETTNILDGLEVTESGVYEKGFVSSLGCDSMVMVEVEVLEPINSFNVITLCDKDAVASFGDLNAVPKDYEEVYTAQSGCDSTSYVSYNITISQTTEQSVTICASDQFLIDGQAITESGRYETTYAAANGCDSTHSVELTVLAPIAVEESFAICAGESMSIFGTEVTETTTQTQTFTGASGCDSIHTIHLLVKETYEEVDKITLCAGETTNILDGVEVTESGVYEKGFISSLGCDSMVMVEVTVMEPITSHNIITMCEDEAIAVFGEESAIPSDYEEHYTAQSGCDSTHYVSYNITTSQETEETVMICASDQFLLDGKEITESGRYTSSFIAANGCDSMHITNVTIMETLITSATYELCPGEQMDVFGEMVNVSGTFSNNFSSTSGCDSLHTITVFVKESQTTDESITICEGESITVFDKLISSDDQLSRTFSGTNGCDSTHTVQVNVLKKVYAETNQSLCQANCITLYGATACGNNIFQETLTASSGCDSIHTVNLTITEAEEVIIEYTLCEGDSIEALGGFLKEAGTFSTTFSTNSGCDSIHTVNLKISEPTTVIRDYMLCPGDSLAALGTYIKEAGTFSETFTAANGCDSTHTVNLVLSESIEVVSEYILCEGDSLSALGTFIKTEGAFSETYTSNSGCDSTHTVVVNFTEPISANITTNPACPEDANGAIQLAVSGGFAPYQIEWNGANIGTATGMDNLLAGEYSVAIIDSMGCQWEEQITIESAQKPTFETAVMDVSCFGDTDGSISLSSAEGIEFSLDGINFSQNPIFSDLRPSQYEVSFKDALGCVFSELVQVAEPVQMEVSLPDVTTINLGTSLTLEPNVITSSTVNYEWLDSETLSCLACENPVATPVKDTKYTVTVYDENNCESQAETWVKIEFNKGVYVPNVFSPDNNGENDIFTIQAADGPIEEVAFFKVYDRWGTLLYEANNFHPNDEGFGWNGTYRGQEMGVGVYIYVAVVKFKDGSDIQLQGDVTLIK